MSHIIAMEFQVPSYAFVTEHGDACDTVDVTYALFYPFNYGKVKVHILIKNMIIQNPIILEHTL